MRLLPCLNPTTGWRKRGINPLTGRKFGMSSADEVRRSKPFLFEEVSFRCGKCLNCLKYRGSTLMSRCVAESIMHVDSAFITLTVSDDCMDDVFPGSSLCHRPFQLFCKRLRKAAGSSSIKYMMCGEYGEISLRPHFHAIVFGLPAFVYHDTKCRRSDCLGFYKSREDNPLFSKCWPYGEVFCGTVTPASIAYVSGYTLKQFVLGRDENWYKDRFLSPEYVRWSRRPGLGHSYFEKYGLHMDSHSDGSIDCGVPVDGRRVFPGRYFLDWLRLTSVSEYDRLLASYELERRNDSSGISEVDEFNSLLAERGRRFDCLVYRTLRDKRL